MQKFQIAITALDEKRKELLSIGGRKEDIEALGKSILTLQRTNIENYFDILIQSPIFKQVAKQKNGKGSRHRMAKNRFLKGTLGLGSMVDFLIEYGFEIKVFRTDIK